MSYFGNFGRVFPPPYGQQFVNYQGLLINVVGTTGPFLMPQNQPLDTQNLLTVTSMAGVPTSAPPGGSFAYNSATNVVYVYITGTGWIPITGAGAVETWAQTLAAGNTTGATNPVISAGRAIIWTGGVNIASNGVTNTTTTSAVSSVLIGGSITGSGTECTNIGVGTNSGALQGCTLVGNGASASGGGGATSVGWNSSGGTGCTALGWLATAAGSTNSTVLGTNASSNGFSDSTALGANAVCTAANQIQMGRNTETVNVRGALTMGQSLPVGTTFNFLTLTGINGTPTGAALEGSLAMDTTNHLAYLRTNTAWVQIQTGTGATPTWNAVLTAGNTTGAVNPVVSSGQALVFTSGVCIGSAGVAPGTATPDVTCVIIGGGSVGTGANITVVGRSASTGAGNQAVAVGFNAFALTGSVAVGYQASASGNNSVVIGSGATNANVSGVTIGLSATAGGINSTNIGYSSATTGSGGTAYGYSSSAAQNSVAIGPTCSTNTSTGAIVIGSLAALAAGCTNSILIGGGATALAAVTGAIAIGPSAALNSIDAIGIGRGCGANGQSSVNIGLSITNHANNSNCVLVGPNIANTQTGNTGNVAVGPSITFTAGANSTNNIALGSTVTVPAGVVKTFYLPTNMTTAAASTAVNYNTVTGQIYPVTSARKFKQNIRDLENVNRILNAVPRKYNMAKGHCHCPPVDGCDGTCCEEVGVIADEMEAVGLSDFVVYGDHDRKEAVGVLYDRMVVPLIAVVKSQQERLDILEEQLAKLLSSKP